MSSALVVAAAGDAAAPWIAFGSWGFFGLLGAFTTAWKGRSVGWGFAVGLLVPVFGNLVLFGLEPYPSLRDRPLTLVLGVATAACALMVVVLLASITSESSGAGRFGRPVLAIASDEASLDV